MAVCLCVHVNLCACVGVVGCVCMSVGYAPHCVPEQNGLTVSEFKLIFEMTWCVFWSIILRFAIRENKARVQKHDVCQTTKNNQHRVETHKAFTNAMKSIGPVRD